MNVLPHFQGLLRPQSTSPNVLPFLADPSHTETLQCHFPQANPPIQNVTVSVTLSFRHAGLDPASRRRPDESWEPSQRLGPGFHREPWIPAFAGMTPFMIRGLWVDSKNSWTDTI